MPSTARCYDWVFSNTSNVSVAKDREWFTSYTPFTSVASPGLGVPATMQVLGIGTVEIDVKKSITTTGRKSQNKLVLRDVLHVPSAFCNILGGSFMHDKTVDFGSGKICNENGHCIALMKIDPLYTLILKGHAQPSVFEEGDVYYVHCSWPESEKMRWEDFTSRASAPTVAAAGLTINDFTHHESQQSTDGSNKFVDLPPYSADEKRWLKESYGGEFRFLRMHQLKIHDDADRAEGRGIVRAMIQAEEDDFSNEEEEDFPDEEDEQEILSDVDDFESMEPEDAMACSYFDHDQRVWVQENYGSAINFLLSYGLKFYEPQDCEEGLAILEECMKMEQDEKKKKTTAKKQENKWNLTSEQNHWIQVHYGDFKNFTECFRLNMGDPEDCKEGANIIHAYIDEEEPDEADLESPARIHFNLDQRVWIKVRFGSFDNFFKLVGLKVNEARERDIAAIMVKDMMKHHPRGPPR